jgi:hypothetical protein
MNDPSYLMTIDLFDHNDTTALQPAARSLGYSSLIALCVDHAKTLGYSGGFVNAREMFVLSVKMSRA